MPHDVRGPHAQCRVLQVISLGVDPSTTRTGIAVSEMRKGKFVVLYTASLTSDGTGMARAIELASDVLGIIQRYKPGLVSIEGYAFGNKFSLATLVELGTLIRYAVLTSNLDYIAPSPTTLKKFVTGAGNTKKNKMILEVYKRWGIEAANDDVADAIGLSAMGLAYVGEMAVNKTGKEALATTKKTVAIAA